MKTSQGSTSDKGQQQQQEARQWRMRDDKDVCRRQDMAAAMEDQMMQRWLPQTKDDNKNGWEWQQ
jgi:hypothetical protein